MVTQLQNQSVHCIVSVAWLGLACKFATCRLAIAIVPRIFPYSASFMEYRADSCMVAWHMQHCLAHNNIEFLVPLSCRNAFRFWAIALTAYKAAAEGLHSFMHAIANATTKTTLPANA